MALNFVGKLGMGPDHPAIVEAQKGNFDFLSAHLASLGPKAQGFEHIVKLAKASFDAEVARTGETETKTKELVHNTVGGADEWNKIKEWASTNADPEEKTVINTMMKAGGLQAKMAAMFLRDSYSNASGTVVEPKAAVANVPANGGSVRGGALAPADYSNEVAKLVQKYGAQGAHTAPEFKELQARRMAYRG